MTFDAHRHPHRRWNPLSGRWVVVSPQRTQRPWRGRADAAPAAPSPRHDPDCHLCPGNERASGVRNPDYTSTFVFENDFASLVPASPAPPRTDDDLFAVDAAVGECRVVCFSPRHDVSLADMTTAEVAVVVALWRAQFAELGERYRWVQIFETRGAVSGASNPHPHGQIWASDFLPNEAVTEAEQQRAYLAAHGRPMLLDYVERELELDERVVVRNDHWVVVVPFWAYWPYETMVLPRRAVPSLADLTDDDSEALAAILVAMLRGFDRLFDTPFPYCSGWHGGSAGAASAGAAASAAGWQLHAHYLPPLLRSADVAKIPASYELLANLQRDLTPEAAATALRSVVGQ